MLLVTQKPESDPELQRGWLGVPVRVRGFKTLWLVQSLVTFIKAFFLPQDADGESLGTVDTWRAAGLRLTHIK